MGEHICAQNKDGLPMCNEQHMGQGHSHFIIKVQLQWPFDDAWVGMGQCPARHNKCAKLPTGLQLHRQLQALGKADVHDSTGPSCIYQRLQ